MATNKKSFILYCDLIHTVRKLSKENAGELFLIILEYVNDLNPEIRDTVIDLVFEPIKQQLKRDLRDWETKRNERSEAGKIGMAKRWGNITKITNDNTAIQDITKITNITVSDNVTDTVTVNDSVKENTPKVFSIEHCLTIALADERWVKVNKTNKNELLDFNTVLEKRGVYEKNPADYKHHFGNWKSTGKLIDLPKKSTLAAAVKAIKEIK